MYLSYLASIVLDTYFPAFITHTETTLTVSLYIAKAQHLHPPAYKHLSDIYSWIQHCQIWLDPTGIWLYRIEGQLHRQLLPANRAQPQSSHPPSHLWGHLPLCPLQWAVLPKYWQQPPKRWRGKQPPSWINSNGLLVQKTWQEIPQSIDSHT